MMRNDTAVAGPDRMKIDVEGRRQSRVWVKPATSLKLFAPHLYRAARPGRTGWAL